jgi:very-short-patch-repair endonuclease
LRQNPTNDEKLVWHYLRRLRHAGFIFRRQQPFSPYIADFACLAHKLIVEIDGLSHQSSQAEETDKIRENYFHTQGYDVLRFPSIRTATDAETISQHVLSYLQTKSEQTPSHAL